MSDNLDDLNKKLPKAKSMLDEFIDEYDEIEELEDLVKEVQITADTSNIEDKLEDLGSKDNSISISLEFDDDIEEIEEVIAEIEKPVIIRAVVDEQSLTTVKSKFNELRGNGLVDNETIDKFNGKLEEYLESGNQSAANNFVNVWDKTLTTALNTYKKGLTDIAVETAKNGILATKKYSSVGGYSAEQVAKSALRSQSLVTMSGEDDRGVPNILRSEFDAKGEISSFITKRLAEENSNKNSIIQQDADYKNKGVIDYTANKKEYDNLFKSFAAIKDKIAANKSASEDWEVKGLVSDVTNKSNITDFKAALDSLKSATDKYFIEPVKENIKELKPEKIEKFDVTKPYDASSALLKVDEYSNKLGKQLYGSQGQQYASSDLGSAKVTQFNEIASQTKNVENQSKESMSKALNELDRLWNEIIVDLRILRDKNSKGMTFLQKADLPVQQAFNSGKQMSPQDKYSHYKNILSNTTEGTAEYAQIYSRMTTAKKEIEDATRRAEIKSVQDTKKAAQEEVDKVDEVTKAYERKRIALAAQGKTQSNKQTIQSLKDEKSAIAQVSSTLKPGTDAFYKAQKEIARLNGQISSATANTTKTVTSTIGNISNAINSGVNKVLSIIRAGINGIHSVVRGSINIVNTVKSMVTRIITLFGSLSNRVVSLIPIIGPKLQDAFSRSSNKAGMMGRSFNLLKGSATELYAKIQLVNGIFNGLFNNQLFEKANVLYRSLYSLQDIIGKEATTETISFYTTLQDTFGLSAAGLIAQVDELSGVLYGLGASSKSIAQMTEALSGVATYLAITGAKGGDTAAVISSLQSVLEGMPKAGYSLGISTKDSAMQEFLTQLKAGTNSVGKAAKEAGMSLNALGSDYSKLTEAQKVYLRYAKIISDTAGKYDNFNNLSNVLNSITGRIYLLKQAFTSLGFAIGQIFYQAVAVIAPYLTALVNMITSALNIIVGKISSLFGIDLSTEIKASDNIADSTDIIADNAQKTEEATKETANNLGGFDRLESINSSASDSGSGGSGGVDLSGLVDSLPNSLEDQAKKISTKISETLNKNLTKALKKIKTTAIKYIEDIFRELTGHDVDITFGFTGTGLTYIKDSLHNIWETIKDIINLVAFLGIRLAEDLQIGAIAESFLGVVDAVTKLVSVIADTFSPVIKELYDNYLSPYVIRFGQDLKDKLDNLKLKLEELTIKIRSFGEELRTALAQGDSESPLGKLEEKYPILTTIKDTVESIVVIFKELLSIVGDLLVDFGKFLVAEGLPWLAEKLKELSEYLAINHDKIVSLIEKIAGFTWEAFKLFVEAATGLIDLAIQHPGAVAAVFSGVVGLKLASWIGGVTVQLAEFLTGLNAIKTFFAGTSAVSATAATGAEVATVVGGASATGAAGAGAAGAGAAGAGTAVASAGAVAGGISIGAIAAIAAAVVALIAIIADLATNVKWFQESFGYLWEQIQDTFGEAIEKIKEGFENLKVAWDGFYKAYADSGIRDIIGGIVVAISGAVVAIIDVIISFAGNFIKTVTNLVSDVITVLQGAFDIIGGFKDIIVGIFTLNPDKILTGIKKIGLGITEAVSGIIKGVVDIVGGMLSTLLGVVDNIFLGLIDGVESWFNDVWDSVRGFFDNLVKAVKKFLGIHSPSTVFAEIGGFIIKGVWEGISKLAGWLKTNVIGAFQKVLDGVKGVFSGLGTWFGNKFKEVGTAASGIKTSVVNAFGKVWSGVKSGAKGATSSIKATFSGLKTSLATTASSIATKFSSTWNNIKTAAANSVSSIGNKFASFFGIKKAEVTTKVTATRANARKKDYVTNPISTHAVGGSIKKGNMFIADEAGAELVGNITGASGAQVANNDMITEALYVAMYNAIAEAFGQTRGKGSSSGEVTINLGNGLNIYDESAIRKLVKVLAPYFRQGVLV